MTLMTLTLVIARGLPASGKTTRARAWVAEDPTTRARVNRDDLRAMLHESVWLGYDTERAVVKVRDAVVSALLRRGVSVVCDDTNLSQRAARDVARLGALAGAELEVWNLTDVPADECVRRDGLRNPAVGEQVIRDMYARYLAGKVLPLPPPTDVPTADSGPAPYIPPDGKPTAVLVDVDGTVALMGTRSPYDETRVHEDRPNEPVIAIVEALHAAGHIVIYCSGRTEECKAATGVWLRRHLPQVGGNAILHMRAAGDMRQDAVVKAGLFDRFVRDHYRVVAVLDDRAQVVAMWRSMGLTVLQVAEGNF
jgi:predicted kinase